MINNVKDLEIFELCEKLAELLGDKEAIADLKKLYLKHPEMFKSMQDLFNTIKEVVESPKIITKAKRKGALLAVKKIENSHKVGEVAIENDNGINVIFHANKKNINKSKVRQMLVETPSAKAAPTWLNRCANNSKELSKCYEALSTSTNKIISQENKSKAYFQEKLKNFNHIASKDKELEK
ncbi:hypothetical protein ACOTVC_06660 [Campylobacter sp. GB48]|uniref:hypothetical protein n=1 Tax=Campylobacter sp. GB48 TaxID=3400423 RepID=UPI003B990E69